MVATATVVLKDELRVDVCPTIDVAHIVTYIKSKLLHCYARSDVLTVIIIKITFWEGSSKALVTAISDMASESRRQ